VSVFDDIADAIVAELDVLGRFLAGAQGDEQKTATTASMELIARNLFGVARIGDAIELYQSTSQVIPPAGLSVTFGATRRNDNTDLFSATGTTVTIGEPGIYIITYTVGAERSGSSGGIRTILQLNGVDVPGTASRATWGSRSGVATCPAVTLDLSSGDEITVFAERLGSGGSGINSIPEGTSFSVRRVRA
jgi:hypothetical protein